MFCFLIVHLNGLSLSTFTPVCNSDISFNTLPLRFVFLLRTQRNPLNQRLIYSYAVSLQQVTTWESTDFHPFLLDMAESYLDTGDTGYLVKGTEQLKAAAARGNLYRWNTRLDCQHFMAVYRDWALDL